MAWLDEFKIAIINEDSQKILSLCDKMPSNFDCIDDTKSALFLTQQALNLLKSKKQSAKSQIARLKKVEIYTNYFE